MFTGIIETVGLVKQVIPAGSNRSFWISSSLSGSLEIDQSLSHNGVCLTVEEINGDLHRVTAIEETLKKTNLGDWTEGSRVNLERCLQVGARIDGHLVAGHVDGTAICEKRIVKDGSWEFEFSFQKKFARLLIEKGSVALNGISLTCFDVGRKTFRVAVIPYTYEHTNMSEVKKGDSLNIEFDMVGKFLQRKRSLKK